MDVGSSPHLKWVTGNSVIITEIYFPSHRKDKEVAGPARQGMVQDPKRMRDAYQRLGSQDPNHGNPGVWHRAVMGCIALLKEEKSLEGAYLCSQWIKESRRGSECER